MLNTVGKDLSQLFDVEPHVSTAACAGVALGRMYPSVLKEHGRQPGIQSACGWSAACHEEEGSGVEKGFGLMPGACESGNGNVS